MPFVFGEQLERWEQPHQLKEVQDLCQKLWNLDCRSAAAPKQRYESRPCVLCKQLQIACPSCPILGCPAIIVQEYEDRLPPCAPHTFLPLAQTCKLFKIEKTSQELRKTLALTKRTSGRTRLSQLGCLAGCIKSHRTSIASERRIQLGVCP